MPGVLRRLPLVVVVGVLALAVLVAALVSVPSVRDSESAGTSGGVPFADLDVGDCVRAVDFGAKSATVDAAPCDQPHAAQLYAVFELDGAQYPGDAETARLADTGCTQRLQQVAGIPDVDLYDVLTFTPTDGSWGEGDRLVQCLLAKKGGDPLTGSLLPDEAG